MKKINITLLVVLSFSLFSNAQNGIKDNLSYQKTMHFDVPISKENAINSFLQRQSLDSFTTFTSAVETSDESGLVHQRHQQFYKGMKVEFGTLITHIRKGQVVSINAELYKVTSLDLVPTLTPEQCLVIAMDKIHATKYLWEDQTQSEIVNYKKPKGELLIFPIVKTGEIKLAYKFDIYTIEPISRAEVYVDAHDGRVLYENPIIKHLSYTTAENNVKKVEQFEALVTGSANTKYSGLRSIQTRFDTPLGMYVLDDQTRGGGVITYNNERLVATYQNVHFKDNDNNWTAAEFSNAFLDIAGLDAHWGAEMTYDFWKIVFNRASFDDNNSQLKSYVHYKQTTANLDNAFWNGSFMTYGDGSSGKPYTGMDICGHEIGHAVCTYTANLAPQISEKPSFIAPD